LQEKRIMAKEKEIKGKREFLFFISGNYNS